MNKIRTYCYRLFPFFLGVSMILRPTDAFAWAWLDKIRDFGSKVAKEAISKFLGIDLTDNCPNPVSEDSDCLFCPLFRILFNAGSFIANQTYKVFSSDLGRLVIIFLAVSLALIVLKNVASMGAKDPGAILNDLLKKIFIGVTVYLIIAHDYYYVINLTITPLFESGLGFVINGTDSCVSAVGIHGYSASASGGSGGGLPSSVGNLIVCAVEDIERKIGLLFSYGDWAFCRGTGPDRWLMFIPNLIYIIDGLFLYIAGMCFMIVYPWLMGDAVLQLGIAVALMPFAICGYAFSGTKQYLSNLLSWILNSLFVFIFMAILLNCILTYIGDVLQGALQAASGDPKVLFTHANQGIAFYGKNMIKIIFILFIGWTYMEFAKGLADEFASGASFSSVGAIGSTIQSSVEKQGKKVGSKSLDLGVAATKRATKNVFRITRSATRRGLIAGVSTFGHLSVLGVDFDVATARSGKRYLKRSFTSITGREHDMASDAFTTSKREYTSDGRLIGDKIEFKKSFINDELFEDNEHVNMNALNYLFTTPLGLNPDYQKSIMVAISTRALALKGKELGKMFSQRAIIFDPSHPNEITIEQVDNDNKKTYVKIKIDPATGRISMQYLTQDKDHYNGFIDNGYMALNFSGDKTAGDILDGSATTSNEVTTVGYAPDIKRGRKNLTDYSNGKEVVDENGTIDPAIAGKLMADMGDFFGQSTLNIPGMGTVTPQDYFRLGILAKDRKYRTNQSKTNTNWNRGFKYVSDYRTGDILGKVDSSNTYTGLSAIGKSGTYSAGKFIYGGKVIGGIL